MVNQSSTNFPQKSPKKAPKPKSSLPIAIAQSSLQVATAKANVLRRDNHVLQPTESTPIKAPVSREFITQQIRDN